MKLMYGQPMKSTVMATMLHMEEFPILRFIGLAIGQAFIGICWRSRKEK